jgi:hypothetical protein
MHVGSARSAGAAFTVHAVPHSGCTVQEERNTLVTCVDRKSSFNLVRIAEVNRVPRNMRSLNSAMEVRVVCSDMGEVSVAIGHWVKHPGRTPS